MGRLVLSRYEGEVIDVILPSGEVIEVMPVRIAVGKVRLSIDAPGNVRILRREVSELIAREQREGERREQEHEHEQEGGDEHGDG